MASVPELRFQIVALPEGGVDVEETVSFRALEIEGDELLSLPNDLHVSLNLSAVGEDVLARGRAWADVARPCDRCLTPDTVRIEADDLCYHLEEAMGTVVDLTESVREDIVLVLPQHHLCRADCAGLCPQCGKDLNQGDCGCAVDTDEDDPWQALDGLDIASDEE